MNRILKKVAIISFILLVLGIVCMAVGTGFGGQLNFSFNLKSHKVYVPTDEELQYVDKTVDVEAFDSLDVELGSVDVEVRRGENYQVQYHLSSLDKPVIEVKDKKLVIQNEEEKLATFGWSFGLFGIHKGVESQQEQKKMVVIIPENVKLVDMKVSSEFGDIDLTDIQTESFDIKADSGDLSLENIDTVNSTILAEFGNVTVNNMTGEKSTITANSGECSLNAVQSNQLSVTAEYGKVKLNEIEAKELVVEAESGDITVHDMVAKTSEMTAEYGNVSIEKVAMDDVNIVCESGNCNVSLVGNVEEYDMDITVDAGNLEINGEEQGNKYKSISEKEKSIVIQSEYGDVNIWIAD